MAGSKPSAFVLLGPTRGEREAGEKVGGYRLKHAGEEKSLEVSYAAKTLPFMLPFICCSCLSEGRLVWSGCEA